MALDPRFGAGFTADKQTKSLDSSVKYGVEVYAGTDVIPGLDNFIGQEMAKKQINLAVSSAKMRKSKLDHTLLGSGLAGIGKTTLARHIAFEMGVGLVECSGKIDSEDFQRLTKEMIDGDILFIDEIHTLGKANSAAWILPVMTEGKLLTPLGAIEIPDITIIGATTDQGKLSEALLSRFKLRPRISHYTVDEATGIVEQMASRMGVYITEIQCAEIAEAGNMNPRNILELVTVARDLYTVNGEVEMVELFDLTGRTADGLNEDMQGYLLALSGCTNYQASVNTLVAVLGETGNIGFIEKDLLARGFIEIQPRGRKLTQVGVQRARALR